MDGRALELETLFGAQGEDAGPCSWGLVVPRHMAGEGSGFYRAGVLYRNLVGSGHHHLGVGGDEGGERGEEEDEGKETGSKDLLC